MSINNEEYKGYWYEPDKNGIEGVQGFSIPRSTGWFVINQTFLSLSNTIATYVSTQHSISVTFDKFRTLKVKGIQVLLALNMVDNFNHRHCND